MWRSCHLTEPEQAKAWRERLGLTQQQLAEVTGYSRESVHWFEKGCRPPRPKQDTGGTPHEPWVFLRYKRACGDLDAELNGREKGRVFAW
jgi:hypothetical protein